MRRINIILTSLIIIFISSFTVVIEFNQCNPGRFEVISFSFSERWDISSNTTETLRLFEIFNRTQFSSDDEFFVLKITNEYCIPLFNITSSISNFTLTFQSFNVYFFFDNPDNNAIKYKEIIDIFSGNIYFNISQLSYNNFDPFYLIKNISEKTYSIWIDGKIVTEVYYAGGGRGEDIGINWDVIVDFLRENWLWIYLSVLGIGLIIAISVGLIHNKKIKVKKNVR